MQKQINSEKTVHFHFGYRIIFFTYLPNTNINTNTNT